MTDVIIAVIPAPGHEGLVAEGPMGERPALLYATGTTPAWSFVGPFETPRGVLLRALQATVNATRIQRGLLWSDLPFDRSCVARVGRIYEWLGAPCALVLHAPGGPRLGMVRAMEAAGVGPNVRAYRCYDGPARGQWWQRPDYYSDRRRETRADWSIPDHPFMGDPDPVVGDYPHAGAPAYAVAHLLRQRGLASEVLVLPVATPADAG